MTTLAQIADRAQRALSDGLAGTWSQTDIEKWICEAILDYSTHFPRTETETISCTASTHAYDLATDYIDTILVEYPKDEDPPEYLARLARTHPSFWGNDGFYDIEPARQAGTQATLYISDTPTASEEIEHTYSAHHTVKLNSDSAITVPEYHEPILILYVLWAAYTERLSQEEQGPDTTIHLMEQYRTAAQTAWTHYQDAITQAIKQQARGGITGPWRADIHDPIY